MTTRARQVRLMRSLGFTLRDRGAGTPPDWALWWDHPTGGTVGLLPSICPTAAQVVTRAIRSTVHKTLVTLQVDIETSVTKAKGTILRDELVISKRVRKVKS